jgi:hypothetical protein
MCVSCVRLSPRLSLSLFAARLHACQSIRPSVHSSLNNTHRDSCLDPKGLPDVALHGVQALKKSNLPSTLRMVGLCNRPNYEFRAFQVG